MRIRRLRLVNFKRFADHEIVLEPGLNLIVGPNESGKSSIAEALSTVLFADPASRADSVRSLERWGGTGGMRLELDFEQGTDSYRLTKDFGSGLAELARRTEGDVIADRAEIDQVIARLVGFETREAFESIASVYQDDLASLGGRGGEARRGALVPLIERKMTSSSGRVDATRVVDTIGKRMERLRVGTDRPAKHPGPLKRLLDRRDELQPRAAVIRKRWDETQRIRSELARTTEEVGVAAKELAYLDETFLNEETRRGQQEELGRLRTAFDERAAKIGRIRKLRGDVADAWDALVQGSREQEKEAISAKAALDALDDRVVTLKSLVPGEKSPQELKPGVPVAIVGAAAIASIAVPLLVEMGEMVKWGLIAGGVGLGAWGFFLLRKAARIWSAAQEIRGVLQERRKRETVLSAALLKLGIRTYGGLEEYAAAQDEARRNVDVWNATLYEVCEGTDPESVERELQTETASLESRILEMEGGARAAAASGSVVTAVDVSKLRAEREELSDRVNELSDSIKHREAQLESMEVDETLPDIEAEIEHVTSEIAGIERHIRILGLTRDSLMKAMASANEEAATVLEPIVNRVLSRSTLGRYSRVIMADDLDLSVSTPSGTPSAPVSLRPTNLSKGTLDQLYFAVRFALLEFLSPGDGSPLILDDALVHWDPNRRSATLELLDEISEKRQILLFTCEGYGSEFADSLVLLPGA
ncbi:MAG: AAA family ATPase [Candidatus Eisenbacteria bacterium]